MLAGHLGRRPRLGTPKAASDMHFVLGHDMLGNCRLDPLLLLPGCLTWAFCGGRRPSAGTAG